MDRATWLEARRKGIGSSDIANIVGVAPAGRGGSLGVWRSKVLAAESEIPEELAYWGNEEEPLLLRRYQRDHPECFVLGPTLRVNDWGRTEYVDQEDVEHDLVTHPEVPIAMASLDGVAYVGDLLAHEPIEVSAILECKNVNAYARGWGADGEADAVPEHLRVQVVWQMGVTGWHQGVILALHGGNDFREHPITWDPELFDYLLSEAVQFWTVHVEGNKPPLPENAEQARMMFPRQTGETLVAEKDSRLDALIWDRVQTAALLAEGKASLDRIDGEIMGRMEWHGTLETHLHEKAATWLAPEQGRSNWKPVAEELRSKIRMGDEKWKQLQDQHRAKPSRTFRFSLKSE